MQNLLTQIAALVIFLHAHPREAAIVSLLAALVTNWGLGSIDAALRGEFSFQEWPRILRSQLASTEAQVIGRLIVAAAVTAWSRALFPTSEAQLVDTVLGAVLTALAGASALYSAALWREDLTQIADLKDILLARFYHQPAAPRRNRPRHEAQVTGLQP